MPRFQLVFALFVSATLIVGAMWFKFGHTTYVAPAIIAVENSGNFATDESFLNSFLGNKPAVSGNDASSNISNAELTQTDIVGRQLFSDFISLSSQGQITLKNLDSLAAKYAESILNSSSSQRIGVSQIKIIPDSGKDLLAYSTAVFQLRSKYGGMITSSFSQNQFDDTSDPEFAKMMVYAGELYRQAAAELISLSVPQSLSSNHVNLINNYLSSAEATSNLADISKDPVRTYAALNTYAKNTEEETALLSNIQAAVLKNEDIFKNNI